MKKIYLLYVSIPEFVLSLKGNLMTKRENIINYLIEEGKYTRYLEIGVKNPASNFDNIKCKYKTGVDPNPKGDIHYVMTSDDFFNKISLDEIYDIIFIDGLHEYKQVLRDVENSLEHLSPNGVIVLHDCNPIKKNNQKYPRAMGQNTWNGDVWKAFALLRMEREELDMFVVDEDEGCGIIRRGSQKLFKKKMEEDLTYRFLKKNRKKLLRLCSIKEFKKIIKDI